MSDLLGTVASGSSFVGILTSIPAWLHQVWTWYVEYLWNYQRGSWVSTTASTFRALAIVLVAPFAFLSLLDVTSYVIARTLGVIDTTWAATSDKARSQLEPPSLVNIHAPSIKTSSGIEGLPIASDSGPDQRFQKQALYPSSNLTVNASLVSTVNSSSANAGEDTQRSRHQLTAIPAHGSDYGLQGRQRDTPVQLRVDRSAGEGSTFGSYLFSANEEPSLKLSGAGVFSPATSRPSSPQPPLSSDAPVLNQERDELQPPPSASTISDSDSFILLPSAQDTPSGQSDSHIGLRQRAGGMQQQHDDV